MQTASARQTTSTALLSRLNDARAMTDRLFRHVRPEAICDRPIPERHRLIFYVGHLEAFDWNLLGGYVFGAGPADTILDKLFAFGIDPVDGKLPSDQPSDWPVRGVVDSYVRRAREEIDSALRRDPSSATHPQLLEDGTALHVLIEHRLMHAETLAYLLNQLPTRSLIPAQPDADFADHEVAAAMIELPRGRAILGRARSTAAEHFGWDNEFESLAVDVPAFTIDKYKVTNGQFLEFLRASGYRERSFWSAEDWDWIQSQDIEHPWFWSLREDKWFLRGMFTEFPLPHSWPVYVSHAEAAAYARWAGKALPTEAQFHRAAYGSPENHHAPEREYPWGSDAPVAHRGNFDFHRWDPAPVDAYPAGASAFGVQGLLGNGWEWTSTVFGPFPGFEPFPFYRGYSADFFDGKHFVLKGGSPRTAACMVRRTFRNWFQPHYPYACASFRCVVNE